MLKHVLVIITFGWVLAALPLKAQSTSDQALVGRAHSAVGACLGLAHPFDGQVGNSGNSTGGLQHDVQVVGSCFAGGFLKRVTFYVITYGPPCNPAVDEDCRPPLPFATVIATVDFDCSGEIIASQCY